MNEKHESFVCWKCMHVGREYAYVLHVYDDLNSCWNLVEVIVEIVLEGKVEWISESWEK